MSRKQKALKRVNTRSSAFLIYSAQSLIADSPPPVLENR
jgi:hypothetical protein